MHGSRWLWLVVAALGLVGSSCVVVTDDTACASGDIDGDGLCDIEEDCWDDIALQDMCGDGTKECIDGFDNFCQDWWGLYYCVDGLQWYADCNTSCQTDAAVWGQAGCSAPAVSGDCSAADGACLCYCEEAFDSCDGDNVVYTREGTTFTLNCKDYCGGYCDEQAGACAC